MAPESLTHDRWREAFLRLVQQKLQIHQWPKIQLFLTYSVSQQILDLTYLYIFLDPNKTFFEGIKTGRVEHFFLNASCVGTPRHQKQFFLHGLFRGTLTLMLVLKVKQTITTIFRSTGHNLVQKFLIGRITSTYRKSIPQ